MKTTVLLNSVFSSCSIAVAASILGIHREPELGDMFCLGLVGYLEMSKEG